MSSKRKQMSGKRRLVIKLEKLSPEEVDRWTRLVFLVYSFECLKYYVSLAA
jgi:hypothetical protein